MTVEPAKPAMTRAVTRSFIFIGISPWLNDAETEHRRWCDVPAVLGFCTGTTSALTSFEDAADILLVGRNAEGPVASSFGRAFSRPLDLGGE
jgi:hypothetical protein